MNNQSEVTLWIVKQASKQSVKSGAVAIGLPPQVAHGLADQLSFTWDLLKKGQKISAAQLSVLLIMKGIGIGRMAAGSKYQCAAAVATALATLGKTIAFAPSGAGALLAAIDLLKATYEMDRECKLSDAVSEKIHATVEPAAIWLEVGVTQWLMRGTGY